MPDPTCDPQLECLAGIVNARLNRASSGTCDGVYLYAPHIEANTRMPSLWAWWESENFERRGTQSHIKRVAKGRLRYAIGLRGVDGLALAHYTLRWAAQYIVDALYECKDVNYQSGAKAETLALIEQVDVGDVTYTLDTEFPFVEVPITCHHRWTRQPSTPVVLTEIVGDLDLNLDLEARTFEYDTGKYLYLTPLVHGVEVVVDTDTELSVSVTNRVVTCTLIAGTSTLADLADAVADDDEAAALLTVTGDAGVLIANPLSEPFTLYLSWPITRQTSTV